MPTRTNSNYQTLVKDIAEKLPKIFDELRKEQRWPSVRVIWHRLTLQGIDIDPQVLHGRFQWSRPVVKMIEEEQKAVYYPGKPIMGELPRHLTTVRMPLVSHYTLFQWNDKGLNRLKPLKDRGGINALSRCYFNGTGPITFAWQRLRAGQWEHYAYVSDKGARIIRKRHAN